MKKILPLLLCLMLQACALPRFLPPATDLKPAESEVIVIGKIVVTARGLNLPAAMRGAEEGGIASGELMRNIASFCPQPAAQSFG